jgi:hypothetical protein
MELEKEKFKINIIDFMPYYKIEVGKYIDGTPAYLGDVVKYHDEDNWFISYRYGKIYIKQIGMMAMLSQENFDKGDFSKVEKTNIIGAGMDWLIIGYNDEPMFQKIKDIEHYNTK